MAAYVLILLSFYAPIAIVLWIYVPILQRRIAASKAKDATPETLVNLENEYRKTLTTPLGGFLAIITLYGTYVGIDNARTDAENKATEEHQKNRTQSRQEQLTRALTLLGDSQEYERVSGVQSLDNFVKGDEPQFQSDDYEIIVPVLTNFIREKTRYKDLSTPNCEYFIRPKSEKISGDVQAGLDFIAKWSKLRTKQTEIDFSSLNLSQARLDGAIFDYIDFRYTDLSGSKIYNSTFHGANLYCANMWSAFVMGTDFSSPTIPNEKTHVVQRTDMSGALLANAYLGDSHFDNGVTLRSAVFSGGSSSEFVFVDGATLRSVTFFDADLYNANLSLSTLINVKFGGKKLDLMESCFVATKYVETQTPKAALSIVPSKETPSDPITIAGSLDELTADSHCRGQKVQNWILKPKDQKW